MLTERPQAAQSREQITAALLELLNDVPYQQITVTMLADASGYSRRTFYRHYTSIDAVLNGLLDGFGEAFALVVSQTLDETRDLSDLAWTFFSFWASRVEVLVLLSKNDLMHLVSQRFWPEARGRLMGDIGAGTALDYVYRFMTGGMSSMLVQWVDEGCVRSPGEMAETARRIADHLGGR